MVFITQLAHHTLQITVVILIACDHVVVVVMYHDTQLVPNYNTIISGVPERTSILQWNLSKPKHFWTKI